MSLESYWLLFQHMTGTRTIILQILLNIHDSSSATSPTHDMMYTSKVFQTRSSVKFRHAWKMLFILGHASGLPPGISEGPYLAPSSPPDTPDPTYRMPLLRSSTVLLVVSWYSEFPPSMIMSPFSSNGTNLLMKSSTAWPAESNKHNILHLMILGETFPFYFSQGGVRLGPLHMSATI